ncbi:hypothetical protein D2E59_10875 [Mycobacteroides abscessus]|nr:hypothetical protein MA5S0304_1867 [Mycobacteroides abscessus 5S-0304]EIU12625.1 hypothetical protein MA5S0421_2120 [Mycobacteroides abscessus 5S-0421]EIU24303.1 hypothetical protein MA5S0817_5163 [Mycobacteroides abscessus 5S-0817]EIU44389.1 hypothetical protein MA5S1215_4915 [Mycobacteroides abscessus 5S-1215]EIU93071.1 hypothetical protein MA5S0921_2600 [Mycobacteroides abscessus 5S-0921]ORA29002.1 hypothetical protein BST18_08360 [Mycobacteroides abscessus subsp. bolletii]PVB23366.1 hy
MAQDPRPTRDHSATSVDSVQITVAVVGSAIAADSAMAAVGATAVGAAERGLEFWVHRFDHAEVCHPLRISGALGRAHAWK